MDLRYERTMLDEFSECDYRSHRSSGRVPPGQRNVLNILRLQSHIEQAVFFDLRRPSACRKRPFPLNLSYDCPEPVLIKRSFLVQNGSKKGHFPDRSPTR